MPKKAGSILLQCESPGRDPKAVVDMLGRLKRIEGQVRGIQKMILDERSCSEIMIQLTAVNAAVNRVSMTVFNCHLAEQIEKDLSEGRDYKESIAESISMLKKFS